MKWKTLAISVWFWGSLGTGAHCGAEVPGTAHATAQLTLPRIELMKNEPPGFHLLDFSAIAHGYDKVVFGTQSKLMWWDDTRVNIPGRGVGLPSYIDHPEMKADNNHEAITVLGSILGATLAGIDKRSGPDNFAAMSEQYFNRANGLNLVLNRVSTSTGQSYWYELFPQILFDAIAVRYPQEPQLLQITDVAARRWLDAYQVLAMTGKPSFEHIAFDFAKMQPVENGKQREPDAAAALAYLFYNAYQRTGEERFLTAAEGCLVFLEGRPTSASYEILLPFGALAAARMNAERNTEHDVGRLLNDFLEPRSDVRAGWGLLVGNWNGVEVSGLIGSVNDAGGYGFVMNTYASAMALVPIARYDERYARSIAKWMLNAAGAVRYSYPGQLPLENTTKPNFTSDPPNVIAFEGIRHRYKGVSPLAGGDPTAYGWGPCDLGLYGSGFAGVFGGIIRPTSDPMVLELDLLAADPTAPKAPPTHLYYNPHASQATIVLNLGNAPLDLYDSISNQFIARDVSGDFRLSIAPDSVRMLVRLPANSAVAADGRLLKSGGTTFDYENGVLPPKPVRVVESVQSKARRIPANRLTPQIDGKFDEWKGFVPLHLTTSGRGDFEADLHFAWDENYLYVLARQTHRGRDLHEAKSLADFMATPWDFDSCNLYIDLGNGVRASLGDFVLQLAWSSESHKGLAFASQAPDDGSADIQSACSGDAAKGNRVIEARVSWKGLAAAAFGDGVSYKPKAGNIIGCEPMLVEMNHTRQSFLGGSQYQRPTGIDANSVDLVLRQRD